MWSKNVDLKKENKNRQQGLEIWVWWRMEEG
jgi:hypothetical protein